MKKKERSFIKQPKLTKELKSLIVERYIATGGNLGKVVKDLGIPRWKIIEEKIKDKDFSQKFYDADEAMLDRAESKLQEKIEEGNLKAIIFYLKTKGRSRGYIEKTEISVDIDKEIIEWIQEARRKRWGDEK